MARNQANACTILSSLWTPQCHGFFEKVVLINKTEHCRRQPRKDTKKNLMATPFSYRYVNDASDDSNEVCLTYLFLKALVFCQ